MKKTLSAILFLAALNLAAGEPAPSRLFKDGDKEFNIKTKKVKQPFGFSKNISDQEEFIPTHNIKMNLSQLGLKTIALQYEYSFDRALSACLGYHMFLKRPLPSFISPFAAFGGEHTYKGFSITPEMRIYVGPKIEKQAPHGFYFAFYARYAKYTMESAYTYGANKKAATLTATYSGYTVGEMIGCQWRLGKHVSLDWWIIGAGSGAAKLVLEGKSALVNLSPAEQADLKKSLEDIFGDAQYLRAGTVPITVTNNSFSVNVPGLPMLSIRGMGLCLGVVF